MRVLHELNQKHKGIILFHDIHKQSVLALSPVIEELQRQDYTFLAFDKGSSCRRPPEVTSARRPRRVHAAPGKRDAISIARVGR